MTRIKNVILSFCILFLAGCKKDSGNKSCWQVYDALGNEMLIVCDKTEAEMNARYGNLFDKKDAPRYCWKILYSGGSTSYPENISEKMIAIYFQGAASMEKINCGYCQKWTSREKGVHKASGSFAYKPIHVEQYCGDTVSTIYSGRIILLRDTPDSMVTVEFLQRL